MGLRFDRVVEIDAWVPQQDGSAERGYGTGYLVADRLVLAAGHTVRALGADSVADKPIIRFKLPSDGSVVVPDVHREWLEAQVVWSATTLTLMARCWRLRTRGGRHGQRRWVASSGAR